MFSKPAPIPTLQLQKTVAYLKSIGADQFSNDIELLDTATEALKMPFTLVVERDREIRKLANLICKAAVGDVTTVIIPDFSHLGFYHSDWPSVLGDLVSFKDCGVRLISVGDLYDSEKDSIRQAITIVCEKMKDKAA